MTAHPGEDRRGAADAGTLEAPYDADRWTADEFGIASGPARSSVTFVPISQPWLREGAKRWARHRLALNHAFNTVIGGALSLKRFSAFLASCQPPVSAPWQVDRAIVERYLAWLRALPLAESSKAHARVFLRTFLEENRRYQWVEGIAADAVLYADEVATRNAHLPRFIPEAVMAQLESEANLAKMSPSSRHLVVVITETGLRCGDACALAFEPIVADSAGWSCLRFYCSKMRAEQLVPLSARAVEAVRAQQDYVRRKWPSGSPWLFPAWRDPSRATSTQVLRWASDAWQSRIGLHDGAGRPVRVSPHQLRHTLGTRVINRGVPQHVIQRLLGHASPLMTGLYARLHDVTLRQEFERYCQSRVDVEGRLVGFDPDASTADAEWVKHNLSRVADTLPNGYCGRPPQQECPHPNACLTCPQFQTTVQFLSVHSQQRAATAEMVDAADAGGRIRLTDNHRRVLANLDKIITALEDLSGEGSDNG
jgi:integrase